MTAISYPYPVQPGYDWAAAIRALHLTPTHWVISATGGGATSIGRLLEVPGGSRTVLEGIVPYSHESLTDWLRRPPEQSCSQVTGLAMAALAQQRARVLAAAARGGATVSPTPPTVCYGVGCTASLASDRPKRGDHRCHLVVHSERATHWLTVKLAKDKRSRADEERLVADLLLGLLATEVGEIPPGSDLWTGEDEWESRRVVSDPCLHRLLQGESSLAWRLPTGAFTESLAQPLGGVLPGSFNPLHTGHSRLRAAAERRIGQPVGWEMSVVNVDKPPLDLITLDDRCRQFVDQPVALTRSATFVRKSRILPGMVFVVGVDTARRIVDPKYSGDDVDRMREGLAEIRDRGCRFLVAGREQGGAFESLRSIALPAGFEDLFEELPESEFREDISSTALRRQAQQAAAD